MKHQINKQLSNGLLLVLIVSLSAGLIYLCEARSRASNNPAITQQAYLKASNSDASDEFGSAVAVSGDTIVVGAPFQFSQNDNPLTGAAYIFVRSGETWTEQAVLKASNPDGFDRFGSSVAISGDTIAVGAPFEGSSAMGVNGDQGDNSAPSSGAVYIFVRSGGTWSQQAYLKASNTGANDKFGLSVALAGDTVAIGASEEDSNSTGVNVNQSDNSASSSGAAYIFTRISGTWSQQAYLKASNTEANDLFGTSISVSGDTVLVGAQQEDSNASGIDGNQTSNSSLDSGAAYVFVRNGGAWSQQAYLKASNTEKFAWFGTSVSISDNTLVVGAFRGEVIDTSAYVFVRTGLTWIQEARLDASNKGLADHFGFSVSVSANTIVVGAFREDSNAIGVNGNQQDESAADSGAAYVFVRSGGTWNQQAYLKASNTGENDFFGTSVAVAGDAIAIGARFEDSNANTVNGNQSDNSALNSGAVYAYSLPLNQPPLVQCRNVTVSAGPTCTAFASIDDGSSDPDGDAVTLTQSPAGPYPLGNTSVTLTATDSNGASASCSAIVTVRDDTPPTITVPDNITVSTGSDSTSCDALVHYQNPTAKDNCSACATASLSAAQIFGVGPGPKSIAISDFNADGLLDLAIANSGSNYVSVLLGNGDGTFQPEVTYGAGNGPFSVAIGDFNIDGKPDLAVTNVNAQSVSILLGNGNGTFQSQVALGVGSNPFSVAVGDFNGDAKPDLAVANHGFNTVSILRNNANGTFQAQVTYGVGSGPFDVVTEDFNGDGKLDLATANLNSNNLSVLFGNGDGTFQTHQTYVVGSQPTSLDLDDFNGDGKTDLAVSNSSSSNVSVLLGIGDGTFQSHVTYNAGNGPIHLAIEDFNGDGKSDLAVALANTQNISILLGHGNGTFQSPAFFSVVRSKSSIAAADFNRDGRSDLAATTFSVNNVSILLNTTNCLPVSCDHPSGSRFPVGTTNVTCTVSDGANNTAVRSFTVTVSDTAAPVPLVPNLPVITGECSVNVDSAPTATDNCTGQITGTTADPTSFTTEGTFTIRWTYHDGNGNTSDQVQTVIVQNTPVSADAGPDQVFCNNTTTTMAANTPQAGTGTWTLVSGAGTIAEPNNPATLITNLGHGANIFKWTVTHDSCGVATDDVVITRNSCPTNVTLVASKDSFLKSGADNTNEGANERLRVQNAGDNRAVVAFDLAGISMAGLQSATLILNIAENSNNWGASGRLVDAHRILEDWTEGNGRNDVMSGGGPAFRGSGEGVTWNCAKDANISNQTANCSPLWNGANYAPATAPAALHSNGLLGQVAWDVTSDVLAGATHGWTIRKREENQNGQVRYYSREGAALAGDTGLAPRLLLVYGSSTSGARVYVANYSSNDVSVINAVTNDPIGTISVGTTPHAIAVSPDGSRAYVANSGSNNVSAIDTSTNTVVATIPVGANPRDLVINPAGTRLYVGNYSSTSLSVVDTGTNAVVATVPLTGGCVGVAINEAGTRVYVAYYSADNVSVIDTATNTVVATILVSGGSTDVAINPAGTRVYVPNQSSNIVSVIDTATNTVVSTIAVGPVPFGIAINPDGTRAYVANHHGNDVSVLDLATNTTVGTVPVASGPFDLFELAVNHDGTRVFVTHFSSNKISVIDTASNSVVATVTVGTSPVAVSVKSP